MVTITEDQYKFLLSIGVPFEGHVEGVGRAVYKTVDIPSSSPISGAISGGTFYSTGYVSTVIPDTTPKIKPKQIQDYIVSTNTDTTQGEHYQVWDPIERKYIVLGKEIVKSDITIGVNSIDIRIEGTNGSTYTYKSNDLSYYLDKLQEKTGKFISDNSSELTTAMYMMGILTADIGRHMEKVRRFRPVKNVRYGYDVYGANRLYRYGPLAGRIAKPFAKYGGMAVGWIGAGLTIRNSYEGILEYRKNPNNEKAIHPLEAGINIGMSILGLSSNPFCIGASILYFGIELISPGGWEGNFQRRGDYYRGDPYLYYKE